MVYHKIFLIRMDRGMQCCDMMRTGALAITLTIIMASMYTNSAYALNYRPIEFIYGADGTDFQFLYGIARDAEGRLIVTDTMLQKVYILGKGSDGEWRILGFFDRRSAVDLGFDSSGNLVVLTHVHPEGAIYRYRLTYNEDGTLASAEIVDQVQGSTPERTLFRHPHGLAVKTVEEEHEGYTHTRDLVLIGDNMSRRVQVYAIGDDDRMRLSFSFNNAEVYDSSNNRIGDVVNGLSISPWPSIHDIKVDAYGNVIVAYKNGMISIYRIDADSMGVERIATIGQHGTDLGYFNEPRGVAHDAENGYLIVSDNLNNRVQVFNYSDVLSSSSSIVSPVFYYGSGIAGDGERQLNVPRKVIVGNDGNVYLADGSNGRVVILTLDESIPNDADEPRMEPLEESEWYSFSSHREMFDIMARSLYTELVERGVADGVAVRTGIQTTAKELEEVLVQIRTMPENARLNIPWSSHMKGDTTLVGEVLFRSGCTIGKQGSTGISDPRSYHPPPVQVGDTLYCSTTAAALYGSSATIGVSSVSAYFIDPDGEERDVYYYTTAGRHEGIRNMSIDGRAAFYWEAFAVDVDKEGLWTLVTEYSNGTRIEVPFHVGNSYTFDGRDGLIDAIGRALSNSGFSADEVQHAISTIQGSEVYSDLPDDDGVLIMEARRGSLYAFACILPHEPPLNITDTVQCLVLFLGLGSPVTIDDLHVYANAPTGTVPVQSWNWAPGTIPDPFIWLSPPIPMTQAGEWSIVADFTRGGMIVLSLSVTFNVIPESMIGVAGIVAGSLAALAYRMRRRAGIQ